MSVSRGRPRAEGGGKSGSITNHSASIVSLSYRKPSRLHWRRVISVQTIVLSFESIQSEGNHNWLKSLSFFFGQTLSRGPEARRRAPSNEKPRAARPGVFRHASGDVPLRSDS